jgi:hypothetical protein
MAGYEVTRDQSPSPESPATTRKARCPGICGLSCAPADQRQRMARFAAQSWLAAVRSM